MNYKILFLALLALAGCEGDKSKPGPVLTCLGFFSPQVVVEVKNTFAGTPVKDAQVKVNLVGKSVKETFDAIYVENGLGSGSYVGVTNTHASEYQISVTVIAEDFHFYQSANVPFRVNTTCGADNTTRFAVELCPSDALCE